MRCCTVGLKLHHSILTSYAQIRTRSIAALQTIRRGAAIQLTATYCCYSCVRQHIDRPCTL